MKGYKQYLLAIAPYLTAIVVVSVWGIFACIYLSVEDGSSGLSSLGWLHSLFLLPGILIFKICKSSHSNLDIPVIMTLSWVSLTLIALAIAYMTIFTREKIKK